MAEIETSLGNTKPLQSHATDLKGKDNPGTQERYALPSMHLVAEVNGA